MSWSDSLLNCSDSQMDCSLSFYLSISLFLCDSFCNSLVSFNIADVSFWVSAILASNSLISAVDIVGMYHPPLKASMQLRISLANSC